MSSASFDSASSQYLSKINMPISARSIYAIAFLDAGNSWLKWEQIHPIRDLNVGAGIGFRVVVPGIGTIGFDFAYPLTEPPNMIEKSWHTHFQIGSTFR